MPSVSNHTDRKNTVFLNFGYLNHERKMKCGRSDLNARTPTRLGPQPSAFDLARQPPHTKMLIFMRRRTGNRSNRLCRPVTLYTMCLAEKYVLIWVRNHSRTLIYLTPAGQRRLHLVYFYGLERIPMFDVGDNSRAVQRFSFTVTGGSFPP